MLKPLQRLVIDLLCGEDEGCRGDLEDLAGLVGDLDSLASSLPKPFLNGPPGRGPLASRVSNLHELRKEAVRLLEGDEALADYLVRRKLYADLRLHAKQEKPSLECPVCGHRPRIIRLARVEEGLFTGYEPRARCTCGMEWPFDEWLCPSCLAQGRDSFDVYVVRPGLLEVRKCKRCGYKIAVVEGKIDQADVALVNLLLDRFEGD